MKSTLIALSCLVAAALLVACETTPKQTTDHNQTHSPQTTAPASRADTDTASMRVEGLSCPLCAHNLDRQVRRIEGVEDVRINLGTGAVTVEMNRLNAMVTEAQLRKAAEDSGFSVREITLTSSEGTADEN